ncbi:hypothetical protein GTY88_16240, partial [Streptomyces sp. SID5926]|nr:hypothetical protein [Streptomyces sp. SID5926]
MAPHRRAGTSLLDLHHPYHLHPPSKEEHVRPRRAVVRTASALVAALALTVGLGGPAVAAHEAEAGPATTGTGPVTHEENDRVPEGSVWTQHYFPSAD